MHQYKTVANPFYPFHSGSRFRDSCCTGNIRRKRRCGTDRGEECGGHVERATPACQSGRVYVELFPASAAGRADAFAWLIAVRRSGVFAVTSKWASRFSCFVAARQDGIFAHCTSVGPAGGVCDVSAFGGNA